MRASVNCQLGGTVRGPVVSSGAPEHECEQDASSRRQQLEDQHEAGPDFGCCIVHLGLALQARSAQAMVRLRTARTWRGSPAVFWEGVTRLLRHEPGVHRRSALLPQRVAGKGL